MCIAVLEVRYRNKTESDQLLPMADAEAMNNRIRQLKDLDTVERIRVFLPGETHKRVSEWKSDAIASESEVM